MTDEPSFPSPRRRTKAPARPKGAGSLSGKQDKLAKIAEAVYEKARREGWTRKRLYDTLTLSPGLKGLRKDVKDNLLDHYVEPNLDWANLRKRVPDGYNPRTYQESAIHLVPIIKDLKDHGLDYVVIKEGGGYRYYVRYAA